MRYLYCGYCEKVTLHERIVWLTDRTWVCSVCGTSNLALEEEEEG